MTDQTTLFEDDDPDWEEKLRISSGEWIARTVGRVMGWIREDPWRSGTHSLRDDVEPGEFTSDELWLYVVDEVPGQKKALGVVTRGLCASGHTIDTGKWVKSRQGTNNDRDVRVWRAADYD